MEIVGQEEGMKSKLFNIKRTTLKQRTKRTRIGNFHNQIIAFVGNVILPRPEGDAVSFRRRRAPRASPDFVLGIQSDSTAQLQQSREYKKENQGCSHNFAHILYFEKRMSACLMLP